MTAAVFDLTAREHTSRVLDRFVAERAAERLAVRPQAAGENAVTTGLSGDQLATLLGAATGTAAGIHVGADTAMRVATVYACINLVAGAISTLPLHVYERDGNTRRRAEAHDYWWMLNEQANEEMSAATAWECLLAGKFFYGDGFAELLRPSIASSRVIGWKPLHPWAVTPFRAEDGRLLYRYQPDSGPYRVIDPADMIHLPSLGFDGLRSPSPVTYAARESIGVLLAAERYSGKFFSSGATFDYALKTPHKLDKTQADTLLASLMARSNSNAGTRAPLILSGGLEPAQLSITPKDGEILASRLFGVEEICRIFGVPPHMVGHTDKSTSWGSGIEQQSIGFVRYTLQRHLGQIAQNFNRKLWPTRARYFVEHLTAALERGDLKTRFEAYRIALGRAGESPWMDADEIRRSENMAPNPNLKPNGGAGAQSPDPAAG